MIQLVSLQWPYFLDDTSMNITTILVQNLDVNEKKKVKLIAFDNISWKPIYF